MDDLCDLPPALAPVTSARPHTVNMFGGSANTTKKRKVIVIGKQPCCTDHGSILTNRYKEETIPTVHEPSAPAATVLRKTNGTEIPAVDDAGIAHNFFQGLHMRSQVHSVLSNTVLSTR